MARIDESLEPLCDIETAANTIDDLYRNMLAGKYEFPDHQRPGRWKMRLYELLILTIARGMPLAPIHLCEHHRGAESRHGPRQLEVNDGGHRMRGIRAYMNNVFPVTLKANGVQRRVFYDTTPLEKGARRAFSADIKWRVAQRQDMHCATDGCAGCAKECDHVVPLWKGGEHTDGNAQMLCAPCHREKTSAEASERAEVAVGTSTDRVMSDDERSRFDAYTVQTVTYKNYRPGVSAPDVHRLIFRQVQNGERMNGNDRIFSERNEFVRFVEKRILASNSAILGLKDAIKNVGMDRADVWSIVKSECNIYQYAEGLFHGYMDSHFMKQDDGGTLSECYVPGSTVLTRNQQTAGRYTDITRDAHLRPFETTLARANNVVASCLPGRKLAYADYAVVFHCCRAHNDEFEDFMVGNRVDLGSYIDAWDGDAKLGGEHVQHKMAALIASMRASQAGGSPAKRHRA